MKTRELQDLLRDVLEELVDARGDEDDELHELAERTGTISDISTFEDVAMLSGNKGLVIETDDGDEFQLTIVRCR